MGGNLSKFRHVLADGSRSELDVFKMAKFGIKFLKPNKGGRERLVENLRSLRLCSSLKVSTTSQKFRITG